MDGTMRITKNDYEYLRELSEFLTEHGLIRAGTEVNEMTVKIHKRHERDLKIATNA